MAKQTLKELMDQVLPVVQGVLIHQRPRWGTLMGHKHGYELWWRAEIASALESWAWSWEQDPEYCVVTEPRPAFFGLQSTDQRADLLVAPYILKKGIVDPKKTPRIWFELKERGTWWNKSIKGTLQGLNDDLKKWDMMKWQDDEAVFSVHILTHEADQGSDLDKDLKPWIDALSKFDRAFPPLTIGFPIGGGRVRWTRMDILAIHNPAGKAR